MGRVVILVYKPHEGKETELRQLIREHRNALVGKGLVTDMMPVHVKSSSGAIVEIFEWKADEAVEAAHMDSTIHGLWQAFSEVCDFVKLSELQEGSDTYANFDRIHLLGNALHLDTANKPTQAMDTSGVGTGGLGKKEEAMGMQGQGGQLKEGTEEGQGMERVRLGEDEGFGSSELPTQTKRTSSGGPGMREEAMCMQMEMGAEEARERAWTGTS